MAVSGELEKWQDHMLESVMGAPPQAARNEWSYSTNGKQIAASIRRGQKAQSPLHIQEIVYQQMKADGRIDHTSDLTVIPEHSVKNVFFTGSSENEFFDDSSGKQLNPDLVGAARQEEIEGGIRRFNVYTKVPLEQCYAMTGKRPIQTRWVDTNKGD